jgi:hypothetical protein
MALARIPVKELTPTSCMLQQYLNGLVPDISHDILSLFYNSKISKVSFAKFSEWHYRCSEISCSRIRHVISRPHCDMKVVEHSL